jgi:hypothetical protein
MTALTAPEIRGRLEISQRQLVRWMKAGLPYKGPQRRATFDGQAVAAWLVDQGHATRTASPAPPPPTAGPVVRTAAEAAVALGVHRRTLAEWCKDPTFPGRSSSPGRRDGNFPLEMINAWRAGQATGSAEPGIDSPRTRLVSLRADQVELALARERGQMAPLDGVLRLFERHVSGAQRILEDLPDRLGKILPNKRPTAAAWRQLRETFRGEAEQTVRDAFFVLSELLEAEQEDD